MFHDPAAMAIDRKLGRIYVLDTSVSELVVLNLSGQVLKRIGGTRDPTGQLHLQNPTQIALGKDRIVVLDSSGWRIQVMNLDFDLIESFVVRNLDDSQEVHDGALALDSSGNMYLTNPLTSTVEIFASGGQLLGTFGRPGIDNGSFNGPFGIWIDSSDRIYVADTLNRRVQMFQARH
jgi:DNA-binding beta-propeller fold protein YncE